MYGFWDRHAPHLSEILSDLGQTCALYSYEYSVDRTVVVKELNIYILYMLVGETLVPHSESESDDSFATPPSPSGELTHVHCC